MPQTNARSEQIATEIRDFLTSAGFTVESRDEEGKVTADFELAVRFSSADPAFVVHLDNNDTTVRYVPSSSVSQEVSEKLARQLRLIASKYDYLWEWSAIDKKLTRKPGDHNVEETKMAGVMEGFGSMSGSARTSYQPLADNVKIIVKHKRPVNEESRGSRSRDIQSIFIQRGEERFKMQENNLRAARAMARHIHMGGEMFDEVGTAITEMVREERKLNNFVRYVNRRGLVNEANQEIVEMAKSNITNIRETIAKLSGVKSYANAVEQLNDMSSIEILEDDLDLEAQFTETRVDTSVGEAVDSIKRSMARSRKYQAHIDAAIQNEDYSNLKDALIENDLEFATPYARLGHQVSQMANVTQDSVLRNHLMGISKRIGEGQRLNQVEYGTIKSCLMSANQPKVQPAQRVAESVEEQYEAFINKFDIF